MLHWPKSGVFKLTHMALVALCGLTMFSVCVIADDFPGPNKSGKAGVGAQLQQLQLSDYRGREWTLGDFRESRVMVIAFMGVECPLAKLYSPRLSQLEAQYRTQGVAFVGVDANPQDTLTELAGHARRHQIEFPLLIDGQQQLANRLGATRTPEVFVLDAQRRVRYFGRIDDQYGVGYVRKEPTQHFLREAIDAVLAEREVALVNQPAVGCLIGKLSRQTASTQDSASSVTYSKHIAPIFRDACVQCHRAGQIGPFAMTDYAEVLPWAEMIAEVVAEQRMPPWHANPDYGHFANDCSLTADQRNLIAQWVAAGAPEGDPKDLPAPRRYVDGWQLPREPDLVLEVSQKPFEVPATGEIKYQYFRVDPGFTEEKWISAAQIVPGNYSVVHHILVFVREKGTRGDLGGERGFLVGYVPGSVAQPYPSGAAKRIPAGSELIFQVHYTPVGTPQSDQSKIGFVFADPQTIQREVVTTSCVQTRLNIPPHESDYRTDAMLPETLPECELLGMAPHMHLRGKSFRYTHVSPEKSRQILLDVPRYDFNWQTAYRLDTPMKLTAGSKIYCEAVFDNSSANLNNPKPDARVHWGDQTDDEMMIGYFDILLPRSSNRAADEKARERADLIRAIRRDGLVARLDANKDGQLQKSEVPQRWHNQFQLLDVDGDKVITSIELQEKSPK